MENAEPSGLIYPHTSHNNANSKTGNEVNYSLNSKAGNEEQLTIICSLHYPSLVLLGRLVQAIDIKPRRHPETSVDRDRHGGAE